MLQIKGIDVVLYSGDSAETVKNVLVGEPAAAELPFGAGGIPAYTLAIPKGDTHEWHDRVVDVFGMLFRTVGQIEQGIEANVPTEWHKKIHVEQLVCNGDCTIYEKGTFRKHVFQSVFFCDLRETEATRSGINKQGDAQVCIYSVSKGDGYIPKSGDYIVLCESEFEFDSSTEKSVSESLAEFRKVHPDYGTIHDVKPKRCGILSDFEILAR